MGLLALYVDAHDEDPEKFGMPAASLGQVIDPPPPPVPQAALMVAMTRFPCGSISAHLFVPGIAKFPLTAVVVLPDQVIVCPKIDLRMAPVIDLS
jgi:hypothetical protein